MPLWKLVPVAQPGDPRWQDHAVWREVVVRAETASLARLLAARLERDPTEAPSGNESLTFESAFQDEKLYWAIEIDARAAAAFGGAAGEPGILRAVPFAEAERERSDERRR